MAISLGGRGLHSCAETISRTESVASTARTALRCPPRSLLGALSTPFASTTQAKLALDGVQSPLELGQGAAEARVLTPGALLQFATGCASSRASLTSHPVGIWGAQ